MAAEYAIELDGLTYAYPDGTPALKDVNLKVRRGETAVLIGPNGAGKSTLLLHLNGILTGEGVVRVDGVKISKENIKHIRSKVGLIFQNPDDQLFCPTVWEDVAFGPKNMGLPQRQVKTRVGEALEAVGLAGFGERSPHRLSHGQKQRAAIATVLSMDPDVFVFDEPTANLDPKSRNAILHIMKRLKKEGKTIIIATQDLESIVGVADRVFILDKCVVAEGTPRQMLLDAELLKRANLEVPLTARLFEILSCFGYDVTNLPLSLDEAVAELTDTTGKGGRHVHLHVHEHTHERLEEVGRKHRHRH